MKVLQEEFLQKLKEITKLSMKVNDNDAEKILTMIRSHSFEISDLYHKKDDHYSIETADLIVLCFELILIGNKNIDDVFARCLPRFDEKLNRLAEK
jgi:transposase